MIVVGQCPDCVEVVREDDGRVDCEWPTGLRLTRRGLEEFDRAGRCEDSLAVCGYDGEEACAAGDECSAVFGHGLVPCMIG